MVDPLDLWWVLCRVRKHFQLGVLNSICSQLGALNYLENPLRVVSDGTNFDPIVEGNCGSYKVKHTILEQNVPQIALEASLVCPSGGTFF